MLRRPFGWTTSTRQEMERLRREMDRLFSTTSSGLNAAPCYPAMNVWVNEDGVLVTAELPGVKPEDIQISVANDTLTVAGDRSPTQRGAPEGPQKDGDQGQWQVHRRERGCGSFKRAFQLPFRVESNRVEATFENGVLKIDLPRAEADKPKKIAVKAG